MATNVNADKRVYISANLPATNDEAGFTDAGVVWTEINEVNNSSGWVRTHEMAERQPLDARMPIRRKVNYDFSPLSIECTEDDADAGQTLAKAAEAVDTVYSIKEVKATGLTRCAQCKIDSTDNGQGGAATDFVALTISAQPQEEVVEFTPA